jgi:hypothetical protein
LIGVGRSPAAQQDGPSRISTFVPAFNVSLPAYDYRSYDPAAIGSSVDKQYDLPLMSPDENALAFFVSDQRNRTISLWLDNYGKAPQLIVTWSAPADSKIALTPVAAWTSPKTFLFAEPADWKNGLPTKVQLHELTVEQDGSAKIGTATTLNTHGTERGIALEELAVSQMSGRVAYRLRHFARSSSTEGLTDTVEIASAYRIADANEVTREGSASGISWSPDGQILASISPHELEFISGSGRVLEQFSGLTNPSDPRWVTPNEVWYGDTNDQGASVMTVQLH